MKKSKSAAKLWPQRWYFYSKIREIQEEEAQKVGELRYVVIRYYEIVLGRIVARDLISCRPFE